MQKANQQPQSKQFPIRRKPETFQLTYNGAIICTGNANLCFGRKANLLKGGNYSKKYFQIVPVKETGR